MSCSVELSMTNILLPRGQVIGHREASGSEVEYVTLNIHVFAFIRNKSNIII